MYLIRERFFRLGEDSDITDEHGQPVLHVDVAPGQDDLLLLASVLALDLPKTRSASNTDRSPQPMTANLL